MMAPVPSRKPSLRVIPGMAHLPPEACRRAAAPAIMSARRNFDINRWQGMDLHLLLPGGRQPCCRAQPLTAAGLPMSIEAREKSRADYHDGLDPQPGVGR